MRVGCSRVSLLVLSGDSAPHKCETHEGLFKDMAIKAEACKMLCPGGCVGSMGVLGYEERASRSSGR